MDHNSALKRKPSTLFNDATGKKNKTGLVDYDSDSSAGNSIATEHPEPNDEFILDIKKAGEDQRLKQAEDSKAQGKKDTSTEEKNNAKGAVDEDLHLKQAEDFEVQGNKHEITAQQ